MTRAMDVTDTNFMLESDEPSDLFILFIQRLCLYMCLDLGKNSFLLTPRVTFESTCINLKPAKVDSESNLSVCIKKLKIQFNVEIFHHKQIDMCTIHFTNAFQLIQNKYNPLKFYRNTLAGSSKFSRFLQLDFFEWIF